MVAGLLLRLAALPLDGTEDVFVWKTWSHGALTQGLTRVYGVGGTPPERGVVRWGNRYTTVDYPPLAVAALAAAGRLYRLHSPAFEDSPWLNVAMKGPSVLAECGLTLLLWQVVRRRRGDAAARLAAAAFWANPAMILAGPALGYLDPLMALPAAAALAAAGAGLAGAAGALAAAACLTKAQAIFVLPAVALGLWGASSGRVARFAAAAGAGGLVAAAAVLPYAAAGAWRNLAQAIGSLLRHDMLSGNAANAWWIVTWVLRAVYAIPDLGPWDAWTMRLRILGVSRVVALGYPNPRPVTLAAVLSAAAWAVWRARRQAGTPVLLACAAFIVHAYFVLGVQVHENHLYLSVPLLAGAAACTPVLRPVLAGVSLVFALNLYLFYGLGRGFPLPPRNLTVVDATVLLAVANCALLVWHARRYARACRPPAAADAAAGRVSPGSTRRCGPASPAGSG